MGHKRRAIDYTSIQPHLSDKNKTSTQTALFETFLLGRPQIVAGTVKYSVRLAKQQHGKSHTMP